MQIRRLEFYISPLKLFEFLNQGEREGKLAMLQDATEEGYTVIAYGSKVLAEKTSPFELDKIRKICSELEDLLHKQNEVLAKYIDNYQLGGEVSKLPFLYGLIGFFSYDLGLGFENIVSKHKDDQNYPGFYFLIPEEILVLDHLNKVMWLILTGEISREKVDFFENLRNIHFKESRNARSLRCEIGKTTISCDGNQRTITSNLSKSEYKEKIYKIKDRLNKGETYQVNFSQRFVFGTEKSPWEIYKSVTAINPTKHQAFFQAEFAGEEFFIVSNSPERLFKISYVQGKREIETRPIKGTVGVLRDETPEQLKKLGESLVLSDKDRAELEMIVDMSRNDLGRICEFGSVHVDEHRTLEKYSHLFHTVSNVSGSLKDTVKLYDILRAVFPGASITGCPKKRTMEIIDELEEFPRGVYCGSMGYLDSRGGADFNIMIRTLFAKHTNNVEEYGYIMHSGGGITVNSDPDLEFKETFDKVKAFLEALK